AQIFFPTATAIGYGRPVAGRVDFGAVPIDQMRVLKPLHPSEAEELRKRLGEAQSKCARRGKPSERPELHIDYEFPEALGREAGTIRAWYRCVGRLQHKLKPLRFE